VRIEAHGHSGIQIQSFRDWETYALPEERRHHWKTGRSACELGRIWTVAGEPSVPAELTRLLESNEATRGIVFSRGVIEHETPLPFGNRGARCHDLALYGEQNGHPVTICIESKADESFGGTVESELTKARKRTGTRFPERLNWLTSSLFGTNAFEDGCAF